MIDEVGLTQDERETLIRAQEMYTLSLHNGWRTIRGVMRQWEVKALTDMAECQSSDPIVRSNLQLRWDERRKNNKMLDDYIADVLQQRIALLAAIALLNGNSPQEALTIAETL